MRQERRGQRWESCYRQKMPEWSRSHFAVSLRPQNYRQPGLLPLVRIIPDLQPKCCCQKSTIFDFLVRSQISIFCLERQRILFPKFAKIRQETDSDPKKAKICPKNGNHLKFHCTAYKSRNLVFIYLFERIYESARILYISVSLGEFRRNVRGPRPPVRWQKTGYDHSSLNHWSFSKLGKDQSVRTPGNGRPDPEKAPFFRTAARPIVRIGPVNFQNYCPDFNIYILRKKKIQD